jgi:serine phosphatase RsbU (regulator of sigma subunit)
MYGLLTKEEFLLAEQSSGDPKRQSARRSAKRQTASQPAPTQGKGTPKKRPRESVAGGNKPQTAQRKSTSKRKPTGSMQAVKQPRKGTSGSLPAVGAHEAREGGGKRSGKSSASERTVAAKRTGKSDRASSRSGTGGAQGRRQGLRKRGLGLAAKFSIPVCLLIIVCIGGWGFWIARDTEQMLLNDVKKNGVTGIRTLTQLAERVFHLKGRYPGTWAIKMGYVERGEIADFIEEGAAPKEVAGHGMKLLEYLDARQDPAGGEGALPEIPRGSSGGIGTGSDFLNEQEVLERAQSLARAIASGLLPRKGLLKDILKVEQAGGGTAQTELLDAYIAEMPAGSETVDQILTARPARGERVTLAYTAPPEHTVRYGKSVELEDIVIRALDAKTGGKVEPALSFSGEFDVGSGSTGRKAKLFLLLSAERIDEQVNNLRMVMLGLGTAAVLLAAVVCYMVAWGVTAPVHALIRDMDVVAQGDLDHQTEAHSSDEIGAIAVQFNDMTKRLKLAQEAERENQRYEDELEMAREIQIKLLPPRLPHIKGLDISATYKPAKEVGGDYYDVFGIDKEHLGIVVADVSGKGIPGSMVMATTRTILRFVAARNTSPTDTLVRTNQVVAADIRRGMFVTALYIVFNARTYEMRVASAGHNPLVVYRAAAGKVEQVNPSGIALGFDKGPLFEKTMQEEVIKLGHGDRAVLYTDGVVEAMNAQNEEYSDERFYQFTQKNADKSSEAYVQALLQDLEAHKGAAEQHDDITVVTFKSA